MTIGVLELQGDFEKHHQILQTLGFESVSVRNQIDLQTISGLVIPGGESTTFSKLIDQNNLRKTLKVFANKYPILGTCAGLIIMAQKVSDSKVKPLGIFDIDVTRNAYGRQIHSSTKNIQFLIDRNTITCSTTMIRAPRIDRIGKNVEIIGSFNENPIAIREGHHVGLNFHPELNGISHFHKFTFLQGWKTSQTKQENRMYVT